MDTFIRITILIPMSHPLHHPKISACIAAGFEVQDNKVWAYGREFPLAEPYAIHLNVYRTDPSHETRYQAMKAAFDILWPDKIITYNYWMERMFREHCNHETDIFTLAGGGGIGKTEACARIASLFFLAQPYKRAVIVTSTTLESLKSRIYGYIMRALKEISFPIPIQINKTPPVVHPVPIDFIHGIYGVAVKQGTDEQAIDTIKGRHPKLDLLLILDEATDMPMGIVSAIPNLSKGLGGRLQVIAIGNSTSTTDLHGSLSTPKNGWDSIDPKKDFRWETTQPNGICLYFNPYDSPAIHEPDPYKKRALSSFLMTEDKIIKAEREEGTESEGFWRMTMGFWQNRSTDKTVVSEAFLKDYDPTKPAEFSGKYELHIVAGLDPAFSVGGDKCILRFAILGHHINGKIVLDYRGPSLLFEIKILARTGKSAEIQIADQVIEICRKYNVPLNTLCIDASGAGRGLADVIQLRSGGGLTPTKIYSTALKTGTSVNKNDANTIITSAHEMWFQGREFISHMQIHGMDSLAYHQLHNRQIIDKNGKKELERKDAYKKRMASMKSSLGKSPDEADAAMLCLQSAVLHYGFFPGQEKERTQYDSEDSRQFAIALKQYQEQHQSKRPFILKGNYSNGIESLVGKKYY